MQFDGLIFSLLLSCLLKLSLEKRIFPDEWKSARVTPLHQNEGKQL